MDGITDRRFRLLVAKHGGLGATCTEFIRISINPVPARTIAKELGDPAESVCPVGVQLMASDELFVAETTAAATTTNPAFIDLNFGCPVKRVFNKCAGSAMPAFQSAWQKLYAAVRRNGFTCHGKIRAGIDSAEQLEDILDAVAEAGAAAVSLHARLRINAYTDPAEWGWLRRAVRPWQNIHPHIPIIECRHRCRRKTYSACAQIPVYKA